MASTILQAVFVLLAIALCIHRFRKSAGSSSLPLPPGPKPLPIIGNYLDFPPNGVREHEHWLKFKDLYGPISYVTFFQQPMVIIHDRHAATELLEKASTKTSGRPQSKFIGIVGMSKFLAFLNYNSEFRHHRKLVHQQLGTRAVSAKFQGIQDVESRRFLLRILRDPKNLMKHIKTEAGAIILKMTYGYSVEADTPDPLVLLIERMMTNAIKAVVPLAWVVDSLPFLDHLPEGIPGMSFKSIGRKWNETINLTVEVPYKFTREKMEKGTGRESFVSSLITQLSDSNKLDESAESAIKFTATQMYGGGADTTVQTLNGLAIALILFPEVQKKAREEIDAVVGDSRLPGFEDRDKLPYIAAVMKEALRWHTVVPMGLVHVADEDLEFKGYRIPKGSYIAPALWYFLHDPALYPNPDKFDPDRYLAPRNEPDPDTASFGFGRRICPGRYFAEESLFITISRLLAAYDLTKAVDSHGNEIAPKLETTPGVIGHVHEFPFSIKPRSPKYESLIRAVEVDYPWDESDAALLQRRADVAAAVA